MTKALTKRNKGKPAKGSTALTRALARYKDKQHSLKQQAEKIQAEKAKPVQTGQTLFEYFYCSRTDAPFHVVWHRAHAGDKFRVRDIVKDNPTRTTKQALDDAANDLLVIPVEEFDFSGTYCPCCGSRQGFVYCACGENVCGAGRFMHDGQKHFRHNKCGAEFKLGPPVRVISGLPQAPAGKALVVATNILPARTR